MPRWSDRLPQYITFDIPGVSWVLVLASGTTHVIDALLPIIAGVSGHDSIGSCLFDHSFMRPGLVATVTVVLVAFAIGTVLLPGALRNTVAHGLRTVAWWRDGPSDPEKTRKTTPSGRHRN